MQKDYNAMTDLELYEELDQDNDTGFRTEDLVKIVRAANDPAAWGEPMTGEQFLQELLESVQAMPGCEQIAEEMAQQIAQMNFTKH